MRANGDSKKEVIALVIYEGLILGIIGASAGVISSYLINHTLLVHGIQMPPGPGITRQFTTFVELQITFIPYCYLIGIFSSMTGSFLAARKVIKLPILRLHRWPGKSR